VDIEKEIGGQRWREARTVGRLAAAYTLLELAPYTRGLEFTPGDMAAYVYKTACDNGNAGRLWDIMGVK
jgi:hypothetical protein